MTFRVTAGSPGAPGRREDIEEGVFRSESRARIFALDRSLFGARLYWVWKRADDGRNSWRCIGAYQHGTTYTPPVTETPDGAA